jgi:hypothetical protein
MKGMSSASDFKQTAEYQMGFSRGFIEGRNAAFEQFRYWIEMGFATAPHKVIVTTEEFERLKKEEINAKTDRR